MLRSKLSEGGVKSFLAHVVGVAVTALAGAAAVIAFGTLAPSAFAAVAVGGMIAAGAIIGGKIGDGYYHWARGEEADSHRATQRFKQHFSTPESAPAL